MAAFAVCSRDVMHEVSITLKNDDQHYLAVKGAGGRNANKRRNKNNKRDRWKPLDLDAGNTTPTTSCTIAGEGTVSITKDDQRARAAALSRSTQVQRPSYITDLEKLVDRPSPPSKPSLSSQNKPYTPAKRRKQRPRKPKNMGTATTTREYIPPHLRYRSAIPTPKQESADKSKVPEDTLTGPNLNTPQRATQPLQTGNAQDVSTVSTKPRTGTTARIGPNSPPSPPSSPIREQNGLDNKDETKGRVETKGKDEKPIIWGEWTETNLNPKKVSFKDDNRGQSNGFRQSGWSQPKNFTGRNRWAKPPPKKHVWPKNRDLKAQPIEEQSDGGVSYNSNSNGDPNYDIRKLVDWKGDWLPAPVEWDGRKCFTDRHFSDHLELWMNGTDEKTCTNEINISGPGFVDEKNGELAPRYWMPIRIEGEAPRHFWRSFVGRTPAPLSDIDIDEVPWWETYADNTTNLLPHRPVPDAQVDPEEEENQHPGVFVTSKEAIQCKERARIEKERKQLEKRRRREAEIYAIQMTPLPPIPNLTLKPTANIYLRPVVPVDIQQVTDIYNHYVRETIYANEFKGRTHTQIADRIDDIKSRGIPWIVAIDRSEQPKKGRLQLYVSEKVVGFANVDDYCDAGSMYRYTFEMEMFVHHEYLHKGVGKCLLDRMQALVDPGYSARGGYDWIVKTDYLKNGSTRVVKTINCSFPHELGKSTDLDRVTTWLKQFGWRKSGHLYQMGFKHGKAVDVSIFQYVTMEHIEANTIPTQPL